MESIYFTRKMSNGDVSCWHLRFDTHDTEQSQYTVAVLCVSQVCETQNEAKARMLTYLFSSVSQIATICILKNWRMAFLDFQIQHSIFGWLLKSVFQSVKK